MSKSEKLEYIRSIAYKNERVTNWHLSDDLGCFIDKFYSKNIRLREAQRHFTRYANMLVKEGYLCPANRIPLGSGSWSDYHTRTQTVWNLSEEMIKFKSKIDMKKKTVTVLAIEYSKRVCDPQPEFIDRMDVRGLVMSAYRSGYNKAHSEHVKRITNIVELKLSDIDSPVFTHTKEFREHFDYIMSKIKEQFA